MTAFSFAAIAKLRVDFRISLALLLLVLPNAVFAQSKPSQSNNSDTWAATDALGRSLPTYAQVGPVRKNKTVGMFYFLTAQAGGAGPYDNTQILKQHPDAMQNASPLIWGPINESHYWGKPLFGYYVSDDAAVLRKHAEMLSDAGVDVIIIDNSNGVTYDTARNELFSVWEKIRREGGHTPQIAFLCPFSNSNGMGSNTLTELYNTIYSVKRDPDLWFRWKGKPLVLASPSFADPPLTASHVAVPLETGATLGQTFVARQSFTAVGGDFPSWDTTHSGMTLSLYQNGPNGKLVARQKLSDLVDNATDWVASPTLLPPGTYYLEASLPVGTVGWWSYVSPLYSKGAAEADGATVPGARTLWIRDTPTAAPEALSPDPAALSSPAIAARAQTIRQFFTFRTPIAPYNLTNPPPDSWAWLQIAPQAPQRDDENHVEEVAVGVAQNYNATVNRTAPMSFPGAFGRSYSHGHENTSSGAVDWGYNVAEQWADARRLDPPFVFVTGWNEWTAGFYQQWAGFHSPPPIFVDEFDEEDSRDIEPMAGGHGADYYYQLVSEIRRYKGVNPLLPIHAKTIAINGNFAKWNSVQPDFPNDPDQAMHRDASGVGSAGPYVNQTGRNNIVDAKASYDHKNIYFYVRTSAPLTPHTDPDWMLLFLNTHNQKNPGWLGYDFVVNRQVESRNTSLEINVGGKFQWKLIGHVKYVAKGNQMEIAVPRSLLGITHLPATIDFKWADNCISSDPKAADFTLNGDAAPPLRFNYRALLISD